jgi:drug/metabolite transporter (DMT)-like permease
MQQVRAIPAAGPPGAARSRLPVQALLALAAMLAFALSDVLAKRLAPTLPPLEIAWFRYLGGVLLLAPVLVGLRVRPRSGAPAVQVLRSACMVAATTLLIAAVQRMPLAEATTLVFVSPIFVALLSALLLGEAIGWARAACVAAGLAGVVIVVRPDPSGMDGTAFLPLASAGFWATAMVLTRVVQAKGDGFMTTLAYTTLVGFALLCLALPAVFVVPRLVDFLLVSLMSLCWVAAQVAVLAAYRSGRVVDVAPFSYSQIVWALVLGVLFFGELPDAMALAGCAIVIVSGVVAARLPARSGA